MTKFTKLMALTSAFALMGEIAFAEPTGRYPSAEHRPIFGRDFSSMALIGIKDGKRHFVNLAGMKYLPDYEVFVPNHADETGGAAEFIFHKLEESSWEGSGLAQYQNLITAERDSFKKQESQIHALYTYDPAGEKERVRRRFDERGRVLIGTKNESRHFISLRGLTELPEYNVIVERGAEDATTALKFRFYDLDDDYWKDNPDAEVQNLETAERLYFRKENHGRDILYTYDPAGEKERARQMREEEIHGYGQNFPDNDSSQSISRGEYKQARDERLLDAFARGIKEEILISQGD